MRKTGQITELTFALAKRQITARYKGALLGLVWSVANPILQLLVYAAVFSIVFKAKWGVENETQLDFALILFSGFILHSIFAEATTEATGQIINNPNYVKKVVFPLEILPVVNLLAALFNGLLGYCVLILALVLTMGGLPWTALLLPLVLLPFVVFLLGFLYFITSIAVYVRDIRQVMNLVITVALFISPIFFPLDALPGAFVALVKLNPLTIPVIESRKVLLFGQMPDTGVLLLYTLIVSLLATVGYFWYQHTKRGFADVI